ncbi:MAG: GTP cyclohydrolase I FolE [Elusimicrobiota bacterium]|jgi:GTP cyclohydrolase I|nr:GTP cyclohydrolase I FolE [Elusimicrobiota bacterium]
MKPFDEQKAAKAVKLLLEAFGENLERDGIKQTPKRVAEFYKEALAGSRVDPLEVASKFSLSDHNEIILLKDITFFSICEHHLLPFFGKAHIAYIPQHNKVIGISRLARLTEIFSQRLQIQERLSQQIADTIMQGLKPKGVMVVMEAEHLCMTMRGVKQIGSKAITSTMRGIFLTDARTRTEVMSLLKK